MASIGARALQYLDSVQAGAGQIFSYLVLAVYYIFFVVAKPIDMLLTALAKVQGGAEVKGVALVDLSWVFKLLFALVGFLYVFSVDSKDSVISQDGPEKFGLHVLLARGTIFFSALVSGFIGFSDILVKMSSRLSFIKINLPDFESQFSEYTTAFIHGATSLTIIASAFLWEEELSLEKQVDGATTTNPAKRNATSVTYLSLIIAAAYVLKLWQELRHGAQQQSIGDDKEMLGQPRDLAEKYMFKHARGPAITISVALLLYMLSNLPADSYWYDDLWGTPAYVLLVAYIFAVAMERVAVKSGQEWVYGGAHGLVLIGGILQALLFFTGTLVGNHLTQDSIVFAIGVVVLDAMRVGYGQEFPFPANVALQSDKAAIVYRLSQGLFGILAYTLITVAPEEIVPKLNETTNVTTLHKTTAIASPVLYGVGLSSALVKILSLLFLTKTLFKNGTENYYREIASTGLLVCSAYLWDHPLDANLSPGWAYTFFALAILARFADSAIHHILAKGYDLKSYVSWFKEDQGEGIDSPTSDNPRTWLVLLALSTSLGFTSMVLHEKMDHIRTDNFTLAPSPLVEIDGPQNETLSSGIITATFFIALHVAVVLAGLISEAIPNVSYAALSRSKLVRTAVSTVVISSLSVAAGALTIGETALLKSDSPEARLVIALISYIVADTVGRELL